MAEALVAGAGQPVTLVATAPLTNVALLLRARPRIREGIERICLMGGSLGGGEHDRGRGVQHLAGPGGRRHRPWERHPDLDDHARRDPPGPLPGARRGPPRGARHADRPRLGRPPPLLCDLPPQALRLGWLADPRCRRGGSPCRPGPGHDTLASGGRGDGGRADPGPHRCRSRGAAGVARERGGRRRASIGRGSWTCSWRRSPRSADARARWGRGTMADATDGGKREGRRDDDAGAAPGGDAEGGVHRGVRRDEGRLDAARSALRGLAGPRHQRRPGKRGDLRRRRESVVRPRHLALRRPRRNLDPLIGRPDVRRRRAGDPHRLGRHGCPRRRLRRRRAGRALPQRR